MKKVVYSIISALLATAVGSGMIASASPLPGGGRQCSQNYSLSVPFYAASNDYYSGPATAMQTITFLTGKKPLIPALTQFGYALTMGTGKTSGTSIDNMLSLVNKKQSAVTYSKVPTITVGAFVDYVDVSLTQHNAPPIVELGFSDSSISNYTTQGHYMNIIAQKNMTGMHSYVLYTVNDPMYSYLNPTGTENGTYAIEDYILTSQMHTDTNNYDTALCVQ